MLSNWTSVLLLILILVFLRKYIYILNRDIYKNYSRNHVPWLKMGFSMAFLDPGIWAFLRNATRKYQRSYNITVFSITNYCIVKARDAEKVLNTSKHLQKGPVYLLLHPFLRTGLLTSNGAKWQMRRKLLTPAFHLDILKEYFEIFKEESDRLIEILKCKDGKVVDIVQISSQFTLNTICESAMGVKLSSLNDNGKEYINNIHNVGRMCIERVFKHWLFFDRVYKIFGYKNQLDKYLKPIHDFTKAIIDNRKIKFYKKKNLESLNDDENTDGIHISTKKKRAAMMDTLLQAQLEGKISDRGICEETDTFTFEGHDTTAGGMTFTLLLLAHHPEVQEKLLNEIQEVTDDDELSIDQLNKMNYMEMVLKESLRLYPPIPFISRTLTSDLHVDDINIEKGSTVNIFIYDVHRDPEYFPEPEKFDPDRFLPENCEKRHNFSFLAFSIGKRNCIGQRFAMLELKAMLTKVIKNFRIQPVTTREEIIFKTDIVLRSINPIKMKFVIRK